MLFTWDTTDLCIVFRGWHVSGTGSLIVAILAIVVLTAGYEAVRDISRRYEAYAKTVLEGRRGGDDLRGEFEKSHIYQRPCQDAIKGQGCRLDRWMAVTLCPF